METDSQRIYLQVDPDARLAAAVGGAARYLADTAGLGGDAASQLQESVVSACREAFGHLTVEYPYLQITLTRFADRIEVAIAHKGEPSPTLGLDAIAGFSSQARLAAPALCVLPGIDRVQYETKEGLAITRLTKYLGHAPPLA